MGWRGVTLLAGSIASSGTGAGGGGGEGEGERGGLSLAQDNTGNSQCSSVPLYCSSGLEYPERIRSHKQLLFSNLGGQFCG